MNRSHMFFVVVILLAIHCVALAQEKYPSRPIELVVPFSAGGSADIAARIYSEELARTLKVPVNVINRAGGAGIQGTTYVIRGKHDGYTLLAAPSTAIDCNAGYRQRGHLRFIEGFSASGPFCLSPHGI